jgi:hypothetical protein
MHLNARLPAAILLGFCITAMSLEKRPGEDLLTPLSSPPPIALQGSEIGDMLRKWHSNGVAAGNVGDYYDNRDGGHSLLSTARYPQLQKIEYSQEQIKARQNWGLQQHILPYVVFGNSSTSAAPEQGGSNTRSCYSNPAGLTFLFSQYIRNNLYIYPEHLDHDPGHNGVGGYGDLFPTNTPYLITSQGSSGSDQPFMEAMPYVLAAFRPDVKKKLEQSGFLMPTIQMILRITGKNLAGAREYLTGKAHPTVFEGKDVDARAMVEMAHEITISNAPPVAIIKMVQENEPVNGVDYFEPDSTEKLADTPMAIARIFRGSQYDRKIVVSAESSKDLNNRPLKFYWAVLRGDPSRIKIEYRNAAHSTAEITVPYHNRRLIAENSKLESNRVDIGVFVHNGSYFSPPALITFYSLDNEARTYGADGRPLEIAYGAGTSTVSIVSWKDFFDALDPRSESWSCKFFRRQFTPDEMAALSKVSEAFQRIHATLISAQQTEEKAKIALKTADNEVKALQMKQSGAEKSEELQASLKMRTKREAEIDAARKIIYDAQESEKKALEQKIQNLGAAEFVQKKLNALLQDPTLCTANADALKPINESVNDETKKVFQQIQERLVGFGLAKDSDEWPLHLKPLLSDRHTRFEREMIERFNSVLLSRIIFPGIVGGVWRPNYVDSRIASTKEWRDVYLYSPEGTFLGWRRYQSGDMSEFNADGLLVLDKDSQGRCLRARVVRYEAETQNQSMNARRIKWVPAEAIRTYAYDGAK